MRMPRAQPAAKESPRPSSHETSSESEPSWSGSISYQEELPRQRVAGRCTRARMLQTSGPSCSSSESSDELKQACRGLLQTVCKHACKGYVQHSKSCVYAYIYCMRCTCDKVVSEMCTLTDFVMVLLCHLIECKCISTLSFASSRVFASHAARFFWF